MPFKPSGKLFKCKYCDKPAKINYYGIKRLHKGYLRTCGSKECLNRQYSDRYVNNKKRHIGNNHPFWKPIGTIVDAHNRGYKKIKVAERKWQYLHIIKSEERLGRKLEKNEVVHHIDFDGNNNNINNLVVMTNHEHILLHCKMEQIMSKLYKNKIVYFENNDYKLNKVYESIS